MVIAVVSDTHGHVANTLDAIRTFEAFDVKAVLHCGDIGSPIIPSLFERWPTHYVFGNVDSDESQLRESISSAKHTCHGRFGELELAGRKIAVVHGDDAGRLRDAITSGNYDVVCTGHTHQRKEQQQGDTLVLNPGAIYRAQPHSVATVNLETLQVTSLIF